MFDVSLMPQQIQNLFENLQKSEVRENLTPFNILLTGTTGTGKTTAAKEIARAMNAELLEIKLRHGRASLEWIDRIETFGSTRSLNWLETGDFTERPKVVLVDEIELVPNQAIVIRRSLDDFKGKLYFIATCNSTDKIHDSVISRFKVIECNGEDLRQKKTHTQINSLLD